MLLEKIQKKLIDARKNKSTETDFLSLIYSEAKLIGKNIANRETTDEEVITYLTKTKKNSLETRELAVKNNRTEIVEAINREISILDEFLPSQLTEAELADIINKQINDIGGEKSKKMMGQIMKYLKNNYAGQYDGKMASNLVNKLLS